MKMIKPSDFAKNLLAPGFFLRYIFLNEREIIFSVDGADANAAVSDARN